MASLTCAKEVIDNGARIVGAMSCLTGNVAMRAANGDVSEKLALRWGRAADKIQELLEETLSELDHPRAE